VPPAADLLRIGFHLRDMGERNLESTAECPELIKPFNLEDGPVALNGDVHH
jgi:hypothetical protein